MPCEALEDNTFQKCLTLFQEQISFNIPDKLPISASVKDIISTLEEENSFLLLHSPRSRRDLSTVIKEYCEIIGNSEFSLDAEQELEMEVQQEQVT